MQTPKSDTDTVSESIELENLSGVNCARASDSSDAVLGGASASPLAHTADQEYSNSVTEQVCFSETDL